VRSIIIYYSYTGNTKKVAETLAEYLRKRGEVKLLRLEALDESASFFGQAARAFWHKKARIASAEWGLSGYDLICLGTPVWAFGPSPAMNAYLERCSGLENKPVAIFTTYGSGTGVNRCFNYMQDILSKKGAQDFKRFAVQQLKVNDTEFIKKAIGETWKEAI
jgi:flavodoxin